MEGARALRAAGSMPFPSVSVVRLPLILPVMSLASAQSVGVDEQAEGSVPSCTPSPLPVSASMEKMTERCPT